MSGDPTAVTAGGEEQLGGASPPPVRIEGAGDGTPAATAPTAPPARASHLLVSAFLVSSLGSWLYRLTLPLLVLHLTGSALNTAAVYALEYGPFLLLSLPGGVLADRLNRQRLLVSGDSAAALIAASLAIVVASGTHSVAAVYVAAFLLACVEPLYHPAFQGFVPQLVAERDLGRVNAWMQGGDNIVSLFGPVGAGAAIAVIGYQWTIWVDAGTFAFSALAIAAIRGARPLPQREKKHPLAEMREGFNYLFHRNKLLLAGSLLFTGTNLGIWLVQANLVYYLTKYLNFGPTFVGFVFASQGVGAIIGGVLASYGMRYVAPNRLILVCTILGGLGMLALIPAKSIALVLIVWAIVYALGTVNVICWFTLRQRIVPGELLGRIVATTRMLAFASIPFAAILSGALEAEWHDMTAIILIGGILRVLVGLIATATSLRSRTLPEAVAAAA
jgi:MFS family permease